MLKRPAPPKARSRRANQQPEVGIGGFLVYRLQLRRDEEWPPADSPLPADLKMALRPFGKLARNLQVGGQYFRDEAGAPYVWCTVPGPLPIYDALRIDSAEFNAVLCASARAEGLPQPSDETLEAAVNEFAAYVHGRLREHDRVEGVAPKPPVSRWPAEVAKRHRLSVDEEVAESGTRSGTIREIKQDERRGTMPTRHPRHRVRAERQVTTPDLGTWSRHVRSAWHDGRLLIDMIDGERRVIQVGTDGWRLRANVALGTSPARSMYAGEADFSYYASPQRVPHDRWFFWRTLDTRPLPEPVGERDPKIGLALWRALAGVGEAAWLRLLAWTLCALCGDPLPRPLALCGSRQATDRVMRQLRRLIDPRVTRPLGDASDEAELEQVLDEQWLIAADFGDVRPLDLERVAKLARLADTNPVVMALSINPERGDAGVALGELCTIVVLDQAPMAAAEFSEEELETAFDRWAGVILGSLLTALTAVVEAHAFNPDPAALPGVVANAALVNGGQLSYGRFERERLAYAVIEAEPLLCAVYGWAIEHLDPGAAARAALRKAERVAADAKLQAAIAAEAVVLVTSVPNDPAAVEATKRRAAAKADVAAAAVRSADEAQRRAVAAPSPVDVVPVGAKELAAALEPRVPPGTRDAGERGIRKYCAQDGTAVALRRVGIAVRRLPGHAGTNSLEFRRVSPEYLPPPVPAAPRRRRR